MSVNYTCSNGIYWQATPLTAGSRHGAQCSVMTPLDTCLLCNSNEFVKSTTEWVCAIKVTTILLEDNCWQES